MDYVHAACNSELASQFDLLHLSCTNLERLMIIIILIILFKGGRDTLTAVDKPTTTSVTSATHSSFQGIERFHESGLEFPAGRFMMTSFINRLLFHGFL